MELSEIEAEADKLLGRLTAKDGNGFDLIGANEARDISWRLEGLARGAQVKATAAHQARVAAQKPMQFGLNPFMPYVGPPPVFTYPDKAAAVRLYQGQRAQVLAHAADRLHDLAAYATDHADRLAKQPTDDSHAGELAAEQADGMRLAYRDMAGKLQTILQEGEVASPFEDVADRLHELVNDWHGFSQDQDSKAAAMVDDRELIRYHNGQSVAWGKAASMLQVILQEGGI